MDVKTRLVNQLKLIRQKSEQILDAFHTPQQWTYQVHPQANHALWFVGHVGTMDNHLVGMVDPLRVEQREGYAERFDIGSRPSANPADYPAVEEVLDFWRKRRSVLIDLLEGLDEQTLARPAAGDTPPIISDIASVFETAVWHEALHLGQVSVARRALGHAPLVDRPQ